MRSGRIANRARWTRSLLSIPGRRRERPCFWLLRPIDGMCSVRCDQCQLGMTSIDCAGNVGTGSQGHRVHYE